MYFCTAGAFGAPIQDVKEVNRHATATRIPQAPPRLQVTSMFGAHLLRLTCGGSGLDAPSDRELHLILFKSSVGPSFGIVVNEIGDITTVEESQIDDLSSNASRLTGNDSIERTDLIAKVCRCPDELLIVLDPRRFLKIVEQALLNVE
jgi:chemotaxis signal transduction protein